MKILIQIVSVIMGLFSAFLIYAMYAALLMSEFKFDQESAKFAYWTATLLIIGIAWFLSSYGLMNEAKSIQKVFARGFLLWAAEWLVLVFVLIIASIIKTLINNKEDLETALQVAVMAVALLSSVGFCFIMALGCMIGYAVSIFLPKEFHPES